MPGGRKQTALSRIIKRSTGRAVRKGKKVKTQFYHAARLDEEKIRATSWKMFPVKNRTFV